MMSKQSLAPRIPILILLAALIATATWDLSRPKTTTIDYQEIDAATILPPAEARNTDFEHVESALDKLEITSSGELSMSSITESALRSAAEPYVERDIAPAAMQRIQFLINKSLPQPAGKQFADLLPEFIDYLQNEQPLLEAMSQASDLNDEMAIHQQLVALRETTFGAKVSQQFYRGQHLLSQYHYQLRALINNQQLSDQEKAQRRQQLQQAFNQAIAEQHPN